MKSSRSIALVLLSGLLHACQAQRANDETEGPYAEETDLATICEQRSLESCETADELCHVVETPAERRQVCEAVSAGEE